MDKPRHYIRGNPPDKDGVQHNACKVPGCGFVAEYNERTNENVIVSPGSDPEVEHWYSYSSGGGAVMEFTVEEA